MKLLKATVKNFGSYADLEFDFNDLGLALVHGPTGAGKSTLQDIVPWILFGVTAKDGNADEIRSWTNPDEPTTGILTVEVQGTTITITRIRGKASQNDLYWDVVSNPHNKIMDDAGIRYRGKDLTETQKLLEQRLAVTKDLYIAGAYYNEFSPTGAFFTAKAKDRRELFEKLADLELPKTLAERTSDVRKTTKKELDSVNRSLGQHNGRLEGLTESLKGSVWQRDSFGHDSARRLDLLRLKSQNFEVEKEEKIQKAQEKIEQFDKSRLRNLDQLKESAYKLEQVIKTNPSPQCPHCLQVNSKVTKDLCRLEEIERDIQRVDTVVNPYLTDLRHAKEYQNPYIAQIEAEEGKVNPFIAQISSIERQIDETQVKIVELTTQCSELGQKISNLTQLNELSFELRRVLLVRAVKEIEVSTNTYLEKYFDSELRVGFELEDSDDLNISITKNGYPGVYRQMSKGQRGLLKLCFSISVMKAAANRAGVHFGLLCFDEPADGADPELKAKCFQLFDSLSLTHDTILVIDHSSELKSMFTKKFLVTMENDISTIQEE